MAMTFPFAAKKQKPRFYRGFGGILELSLFTLLTGSDPAPPPRMETNSGQTGGTC